MHLVIMKCCMGYMGVWLGIMMLVMAGWVCAPKYVSSYPCPSMQTEILYGFYMFYRFY